MRISTVLSLVLASVSASVSAFSITTPETLDQCHPATFTWTSTQPPYYLSIIESSAQPSFLADAEIVKIPSANQATWIVDLPAGTNATVVVRDASGQMTASIPRIVGNGPSDCFFKDFTL